MTRILLVRQNIEIENYKERELKSSAGREINNTF